MTRIRFAPIASMVLLLACGTVPADLSVDLSEARALVISAAKARRAGEAPQLLELRSFPDATGTPAIYLGRFAGGGFLVLSADRRVPPVLAWSDEGDFPLEKGVTGPSALDGWFAEAVRVVEQRRNTLAAPEPVTRQWDALAKGAWPLGDTAGSAPAPSYNGIIQSCTPSYVSVDPLLSTTWGQGCGYTLETPFGGCSNNVCGRTLAGCVATATAQVMRYFQHPPGFAWGSMTSAAACLSSCASPSQWPASSQAISALLGNVGQAVGMSYGCDGSTSKLSHARDALTQRYRYAAGYRDYDFSTARSEIMARRPVILSGHPRDCFLFVCWPATGHVWVADGVTSRVDCDSEGNSYEAHYLHMNWGWDGSYDGWYWNFAPAGRDYTHFNSMVYGIVPR